MRTAVKAVCSGAVEGGTKALIEQLPEDYVSKLVWLDWNVKFTRTGRLKKALHRLVPSVVFHSAMLRCYRQFDNVSRTHYDEKPAYAEVGRGLKCVEGEMNRDCGIEVVLPRMIRTKNGREVLQHQLIKEREAADEPTTAS